MNTVAGHSATDRTTEESKMVSIAKAIGIISVMIGHGGGFLPITGFPIGKFVYTYHLMIFFFTAGFCYNEGKYAEHLDKFVGRRFIGILKPFAIYNAIFVVLHNVFTRFAISSSEYYSLTDTIGALVNGLLGQSSEQMFGVYWFLQVLLVASILFGIMFFVSVKLANAFKKPWVKYVTDVIILGVCVLAAAYLMGQDVYLEYHAQTAFLAVPVMYAGWLARKYYDKIKKAFCLVGCIVSAVLLWVAIGPLGYQIELSVNMIGNVGKFYLVTLVGIYFCLSFANVILKIKPVTGFMVFVGDNSLHYMALHFLAYKVLDLAISLVRGDSPLLRMDFPHCYNLGLVYPIFATVVIGAGIMLCKKLRKKTV